MKIKIVNNNDYNYIFNPLDGFHARWGKTFEDDPQWSPLGAEILDIEISTICGNGCEFCYKSNVQNGKNMSIQEFTDIINTFFVNGKTNLTQIAFGIGDLNANPHLMEILWYTRSLGIIPNITINGSQLTESLADQLAFVCGGIAVSHYDINTTIRAVSMLTMRKKCYVADNNLWSVNIHQMISRETYQDALEILVDASMNYYLRDLNAILFLSLKQQGRGKNFTPLPQELFDKLVAIAFTLDVNIGFDSCSAHKFMKCELSRGYENVIEPCESGLFSAYINVDGHVFPCSFLETRERWIADMKDTKNFTKEVWLSNKKMLAWRNHLLCNNRECPVYKI